MSKLTLDQAAAIVDAAIAAGRKMNLKPLTVAVVDDGGNLKAMKREDGPGAAMRPQIAMGKAFCAVGMGRSTRALQSMALERPHFSNALAATAHGNFIPVPGGILICDADGETIGAVGVTGDTADNDETAAMEGVTAVGLKGVV